MTDETQGLSTAELTERAGISVRQASHWAERGLLRPEGGGRSGKPLRWPEAEVEVAWQMGRLTGAGLPLEWSAQFARSGDREAELAEGIRVVIDPPSVQCLTCGRTVRLTKDERLRSHHDKAGECPGSGRLPEDSGMALAASDG